MTLTRRHAGIAAATLAAAILACAPAPGVAQQIRGTLVDYVTGETIPRAGVQLIDSAGIVVDSTRSGVDGSFSLRARGAGKYVLYLSQRGYAGVPSEFLRLKAGQTLTYRFSVPLISGAALQRMADVIDVEKRLQRDLDVLCGEPVRPTEGGVLVGVVRNRAGNKPIPGAVVRIDVPARDGAPAFRRATVSSANGVYVVCNIPAGSAVSRTEMMGFSIDQGPVTIRAGQIAWYDVLLRRY